MPGAKCRRFTRLLLPAPLPPAMLRAFLSTGAPVVRAPPNELRPLCPLATPRFLAAGEKERSNMFKMIPHVERGRWGFVGAWPPPTWSAACGIH